MENNIEKQVEKVFDKKVFENETSQESFNHFLDTLDHLKVEFIDRKKFEKKKINNNLIDKEKDDILYLPEDLKYWELFRFVEYLSKQETLWIPAEFSNINNIVKYTKITLTRIFKEQYSNWNNEDEDNKDKRIKSKKEFKNSIINIAKQYWISSEFIGKVDKQKTLSPNIESEIEENRENIPKIIRNENNLPDLSWMYKKIESEEEHKSSPLWLMDGLWLEIWNQFNINFLKRWINMLRQSLGIFTIEDLMKLTKRYNIYYKVFDKKWNIKSDMNKDEINLLIKKKLMITLK